MLRTDFFRLLYFFFCFLFFHHTSNGQIKGQVTDGENNPLPFVSIYYEGSINGTISNDNGFYELEVASPGTYTIVFKYLGFTTKKKQITVTGTAFTLNISLEPENITLNEVAITAKENPANRVIQNAIESRKKYQKELQNFTASFYSKGLIKIKDAPERILGQDVGDLGGGLDSTRSGIVYLSETISDISKRNNDFKEKIIASKVSGDDNGFSFNTATDVNFSFYENTVELGNQLISPIADNAFNYYRYRLLGTFYDDLGNLVNQIQVIPRRAKDRVFNGTIYIIEDNWAIYAVELAVTGEQAKIIPVDTFFIKQSFNYLKSADTWLKTLQSFDFKYNIFGFKGEGRFTAGYKEYDLQPNFTKKTFGNEVLSFVDNANKKDSIFWNTVRPVPLTQEERSDYVVKDSLQVIRESQKYLDSVDAKGNKFGIGSLFFGYTHSNTFKEKYYTVSSLISALQFNTVQGWHTGLNFDYTKLNEEKGTRLNLGIDFDYGFSDRRFRPVGSVSYRFNTFSRPFLRLRVGNQALQFNNEEPIKPLGNTFASLLFENNLAKFYDKTFAEVYYQQEIVNGIYTFLNVGFEKRQPLFNTADYVLIDDEDDVYTSNNPLQPDNFVDPAIATHEIIKLSLTTRIRFGQKYQNYPDGKFNLTNDSFPTLYLGYETGFASSNPSNNYSQFKARLAQDFPVGDKGRFFYNLKAGTFINADNISFVDFQHFNGNRTRVTRLNYLNSFFFLPYYDFSTNGQYFEGHAEHNFQGFIMNKIPLLKKLGSHLIISGKVLSTENTSAYTEFGVALGNLGWKKFRFLRVGFVQGHFQGITERGVNFGIQF